MCARYLDRCCLELNLYSWICSKYCFVMALWRLKSRASRLFAQLFVQAQIKEDIKALRHWPL